MTDVTRILSEIESGDTLAAEKLLPLVYDELRKLAAAKLAQEKPGQTLQATALVHEAYLKLGGPFENSRHFFGAAAEAMRRILVEMARKRSRERHGGQHERVDLIHEISEGSTFDALTLAVHDALEGLANQNAQAAELVKLRYFAGLTLPQASMALDISPRTADRLWAYAKAWLHAELKS